MPELTHRPLKKLAYLFGEPLVRNVLQQVTRRFYLCAGRAAL
jgi:hypothetical protein